MLVHVSIYQCRNIINKSELTCFATNNKVTCIANILQFIIQTIKNVDLYHSCKVYRKSHKFIKAKCQEIIKVQWKSHSMDAKFDVSCKFLLFSSVKVIAIYCFLWFCWMPYIIKMTTHQNKYGYKTINLLSQFWVHPLHLLFYRFLLLIIDLCFSEKICKK